MKQITVILDDRPGLVADICNHLASHGVNIETLDAESADDHGVVIFTVDNYEEALIALREGAFHAISENVIILKIADKPGSLSSIVNRLKDERININSLRIIKRESGYAYITIATNRLKDALKLLNDYIVDASF